MGGARGQGASGAELPDPQYRAADWQATPAILRPRRPAAHRCLADHRERQTGAARPERAGKPQGAGHAVRPAENEAGGRRSHYPGAAELSLVRGAEKPPGRH